MQNKGKCHQKINRLGMFALRSFYPIRSVPLPREGEVSGSKRLPWELTGPAGSLPDHRGRETERLRPHATVSVGEDYRRGVCTCEWRCVYFSVACLFVSLKMGNFDISQMSNTVEMCDVLLPWSYLNMI